ncbi:MAG TPA: FAD-dependent oxidoreductase, partial [Actinomycetota bacterium]|nr:FAD-dependent oxidoreductase [Actinomycetota bacterium]
REVGALWPGAVDAGGFRWDLLCDGGRGPGAPGAGPRALEGQYWRANVDPSDRYVQSLPGTDGYRIPPGDTGFENLFIAGDWTDCGLNAGCLEAATRSGRLAAQALEERFGGLAAQPLPPDP